MAPMGTGVSELSVVRISADDDKSTRSGAGDRDDGEDRLCRQMGICASVGVC